MTIDRIVWRAAMLALTLAVLPRVEAGEIYMVAPADFQVGSIATLDAIRQEISTAIGDQGSYQWLIVAFTADERWI